MLLYPALGTALVTEKLQCSAEWGNSIRRHACIQKLLQLGRSLFRLIHAPNTAAVNPPRGANCRILVTQAWCPLVNLPAAEEAHRPVALGEVPMRYAKPAGKDRPQGSRWNDATVGCIDDVLHIRCSL
eukprot:12417499-Alexandrium_andersonii.AAC.1